MKKHKFASTQVLAFLKVLECHPAMVRLGLCQIFLLTTILTIFSQLMPFPIIIISPGQVPFLVNNKEKWISGIVEETTCGDVVKVIFLTLTFLTPLDWNTIYIFFRYFKPVLLLVS